MDIDTAEAILQIFVADCEAAIEADDQSASEGGTGNRRVLFQHTAQACKTMLLRLRARRESMQSLQGSTGIPQIFRDEQLFIESLSKDHPELSRVECLACTQHLLLGDAVQLPCESGRHIWCSDCIISRFQAATESEDNFPPRCCAPINLLDVQHLLPEDLVNTFQQKLEEYATPDRTYCSNATCSEFIPTRLIVANVGTCGRCSTQTCSICKGGAHANECPDDPEAQAVLQVAENRGWRRCGSCQEVIELTHGCNHMTCRCGYQFCYGCGAQWETCICPNATPERIFNNATPERIFNPQIAPAHVEPVPVAAWLGLPRPTERRPSPFDNPRPAVGTPIRNFSSTEPRPWCGHGAIPWREGRTSTLKRQSNGTRCQNADCRRQQPTLMECPTCGNLRCRACRDSQE